MSPAPGSHSSNNTAPVSRAPRWTELHALLAGQNRAGVLKAAGSSRSGGGAEVLLVPLQGAEAPGGPPLPIFAAYVASMLAGDLLHSVSGALCAARGSGVNLPGACGPCAAAVWPGARADRPSRALHCTQLLATSRLPLVFDLDETLLVAKSQSQMQKELKALRNERCAGNHAALRPAVLHCSCVLQPAAALA